MHILHVFLLSLQVGTFDPYSDDPRLAIQKLVLCPLSETLVLGGTAGQIIVLGFEREKREQEVKVSSKHNVPMPDMLEHNVLTERNTPPIIFLAIQF